MYRSAILFFAFVFALTACQPETAAEEVCYTAALEANLDDASVNADGECIGTWDSELDETARYTCNLTGCQQACGSNICVGWRPNSTGGCNFSCLVRSVIDGPTAF